VVTNESTLLRDVVRVLADWDPIGVRSHGTRADAEDEYRGYARGVTTMLLRAAEPSRLRHHLRVLCEREMGVAGVEEREARAAASLLALVARRRDGEG
jgi:hypothetical protein